MTHALEAGRSCKFFSFFVQGLRNQQGTMIIHDSDVPNTLIVKFTPAPAEGASAVGALKSPCFDRQLSLRVDIGYPESTPAYFRQISPEQTVQEHSQVRHLLPPYARVWGIGWTAPCSCAPRASPKCASSWSLHLLARAAHELQLAALPVSVEYL